MSDVVEVRDLRSASRAYKRFKNFSAKYQHPSNLVQEPYPTKCVQRLDTRAERRERYKNSRPIAQLFRYGPASRKIDARSECRDETSHLAPGKAELAPSSSILEESADSDILYSFEKQRSSPNADGREVALDELVDRAEEKWENGKTDRMVKEYEVLNNDGGKVQLSAKKGKSRGSQSQSQGESEVAIEDEDFEVI